MRIIGFSFSRILIEKKTPSKGKLEIKSNLSIDDIKEDKVEAFEQKPALKFDFSFTVDYDPSVAKVEMKGSLVAMEEKDNAQEILKEWKKKKFPPQYKMPLFNFILSKCNMKAIQLEDEMGLPIHVPFPQLVSDTSGKANAENKEAKSVNYTG